MIVSVDAAIASCNPRPIDARVSNCPIMPVPRSGGVKGSIELDNATLDLVNLAGNTLQLGGGRSLLGSGTVMGNVLNNAGVIAVGGQGNIDNLLIAGSYTQNAGSTLIVEVFNNGFTTVSDELRVQGQTTLNGGALVIAFTTNSLGLVTANFSPLVLNGVTGNFDTVFDAGGNILAIDFSGGEFTILGRTPDIPDDVVEDLIGFSEEAEELIEDLIDNRSEAEVTLEELLEEEDEEEGSLVCT